METSRAVSPETFQERWAALQDQWAALQVQLAQSPGPWVGVWSAPLPLLQVQLGQLLALWVAMSEDEFLVEVEECSQVMACVLQASRAESEEALLEALVPLVGQWEVSREVLAATLQAPSTPSSPS